MKFNSPPIKNFRKTSGFGLRNTGITGASKDHKGIDGVSSIWEKITPLILVADGILLKKWWNDFRGWVCLFDIGQGYTVLYQHMQYSCSLIIGKQYESGTVVGIMGDSRNHNMIPKMAKHLHFELRKDGIPIDPEPFINDLEEYEMVTETQIKVNGKVKTVKRILKNGENYIRLRDFDDVLEIAEVSYDASINMPIVKD